LIWESCSVDLGCEKPFSWRVGASNEQFAVGKMRNPGLFIAGTTGFQSQFFLALFSTNSHKGRNKNKGEKGGQEDLQTISSHQLALCQA
jgi:hypothetical protein